MSMVTLERTGVQGRRAGQTIPSLLDDLGGEPTLDALIAGVWEGLAAHRAVACPVCGGELGPAYGAPTRQPDDSGAAQPDDSGAARKSEAGRRAGSQPEGVAGCLVGRMPEGGRCRGCESTLS